MNRRLLDFWCAQVVFDASLVACGGADVPQLFGTGGFMADDGSAGRGGASGKSDQNANPSGGSSGSSTTGGSGSVVGGSSGAGAGGSSGAGGDDTAFDAGDGDAAPDTVVADASIDRGSGGSGGGGNGADAGAPCLSNVSCKPELYCKKNGCAVLVAGTCATRPANCSRSEERRVG